MTPVERLIKEIESGTPTTGRNWDQVKAIILNYEHMVIVDAFYTGQTRFERCTDIDGQSYYSKLKNND